MVDKRVGGTFDIWVIGLMDRRTGKKKVKQNRRMDRQMK